MSFKKYLQPEWAKKSCKNIAAPSGGIVYMFIGPENFLSVRLQFCGKRKLKRILSRKYTRHISTSTKKQNKNK